MLQTRNLDRKTGMTKGGKMEKKSYFYIIFTLSLIVILSFTLNAHAMNDEGAASLQQVLGIQPDADYAKVDLATTPEGSVIKATVDDPSKIGGCLKDDRVELINLGNGEWKITRLASGSGFKFTVHQENGVMKITKTETFGQRVAKPMYGKGLEGKFGLGARVSYVNYTDDDYNYVYGVKVDVEPDDAVMFGINFTYFISNYFSFELSADYVETDFDLSIPGLSVEAGEITQIPVLLSGRIHFSKNPKVNPYLTIGVSNVRLDSCM